MVCHANEDAVGDGSHPSARLGDKSQSRFNTSDKGNTMTPLAEETVRLAKQAIGVQETSPNWSIYIKQYLASVGLDAPNPWCAAFVNFKIHQAAEHLGVKSLWNKTGSTHMLYLWAETHGHLLDKPVDGCVFLVRNQGVPMSDTAFHHTGLVTSYDPETRFMHTIEGNSADKVDFRSDRRWTRGEHNYEFVAIV